ncbi:MAG: HAMP domain-containing sensor histidine kinase [Chloroflexota bacterium]
MTSKHLKGRLALLCNPQGLIVQVLRNEVSQSAISAGRLFASVVDQASRIKALNFFDEIRTHAAAFNWELNLPVSEGLVTLLFSGGTLGDQVLIVGAVNSADLQVLYEDMLNMSNEQVNLLRAALKDDEQTLRLEPSTNLYDQISRLNNELVSMQRELARKNAELERVNQLKNQFLGMAAHDLRNPLASIQLASGLLLDEKMRLSPEEHSDFLTEIFKLSQFMHNLVDDLLSVSAIESGQLDLNLQRVDVSALLQKNVARQRPWAASKQIQIELEIEAVPPLMLDPARIEQVLDNLISNAIKFSSPDTTVRVRLGCQATDVVLAVQDQGSGIAAADMEKLFKPFGRLQAHGTGGERSTGLGLVIIKRIVEGHHGQIWLESEVGQGSTFFVRLPLEAEEHLA